ncbi:hypothetical protein DXK93_18560 [Achromobacter sp. K91]|uniref:hypothetical protein n=1 Tax=Achromobacter sp. K91 TaxID=2292262 RepID=UPI000E66972E|nr:hypothetical protein [Achromobacter sp. K91]RIJ02186.1 hypothetical protein DXK93_18560 [Achromobacter sp. K91]
MTEATQLAELPPAETALQVYSKPGGLDPWLDKIRAEVTGHVPDLKTKKGRDAIASLAFKVRKVKTALDGVGKEQVDRLKDIPKKIDAERKRMRDVLDALADEVRAPLDQRAQAERDAAARREAVALAAAETARLEAELADQRRIAAEKQAEIDRAAAAERERLAAEQAERDRVQAAEDARHAEIKRQADAKAAEEAEIRRREEDKAHKASINRAALDAFVAGGVPEDCAKQAVTLIAKGLIPNIRITY